ncbi:hypothetical protein CVT24_000527 [Panaeolus cyanescens]|uniref:Uncharacterized protein n=1 Tax=Panaeolus cyanescens TaxID=181874 RepID=A0A409V8G2_9AGAR|nr:hypothetical protein CVT24_000527 [Panaeolus cyanescens]
MSDPRFARLKTDPRFRRPRTKQTKVVVDERFKSVFDMSNKDKGKSKKVDKYGRRVSSKQDQENLRRYYRLENEDEQQEDNEESGPSRPDYARGEGLVESSSEEEDESDIDEGPVILGPDEGSSNLYKPSLDEETDEEALEIDLNEDELSDSEINSKELKRRYAALDAQAAKAQREAEDEDEQSVEEAERTCRLAIVNLDWDHIRAHHLYKICASLVSPTAPVVKASSSKTPVLPVTEKGKKGKGKMALASQVTIARGKIRSVRIYPSEFGKKRMEREEKEGPPPEIFKKYQREKAIEKGLLSADDITVKDIYEVGAEGEEEYDEDALRRYQIERLRYYYAIVECDTVDAASHIYNELQGTELERSANVFDMSFVPDGMEFDSEPRDEATDELNTEYKAVEFVTDALRHSKVKLTWDDDDPERNMVTRRAMTQKEIDEQDFRNYIANSSDSSSEEEEEPAQKDKKKSKKERKKEERERLRALLLGGGGEDMPEGWGAGEGGNAFGNDDDGDVDMEITFSSALSGKKGEEDETTLEKYQRKMREKRKKRKEEVKEKAGNKEEEKDEFFEGSSGGEEETKKEPKTKTKGDKRKKDKDAATEGEPTSRKEATAEELALLVASDNTNAEPKHFSLKSVIKAEKGKKLKGKKNKKGDDHDEAQEDFVMDVKDERFKALHEDHEFAIDPTNPHFKKTKSMAALLEERQKRQQSLRGERVESNSVRTESKGPSKEKNLQSLVESVKRKSQAMEHQGQGKRRKF